MNIRPLTEADAPRYRPLRLRALREHPEAFGALYEDYASRPMEATLERLRALSPEDVIIGAFDGDTLVGVVGFQREPYPKSRHKGMIWGVHVAQEAQCRGIGRALLREAIARARALDGVEQIQLAVATTNTAARRLYRALGFEAFGVERQALKHGDSYTDEEHMVLWLRPDAPNA
jgi:ribosomal protein S18 acetylase RimI-like enzyme